MAVIDPNTIIQAEEITNGGIIRTAPLNQQMNPDLLAPYLYIAEQTHVRHVLGADLYADLITQKGGNISNYNDACNCPLQDAYPSNTCYESFWTTVLKRLCSYAVLLEASTFLVYEFSNNGLLMQDPQFAMDNAGDKGLGKVQKKLRDWVATMQELTYKYICDNKECFPLACCLDCKCNFDSCGRV